MDHIFIVCVRCNEESMCLQGRYVRCQATLVKALAYRDIKKTFKIDKIEFK